MTDDMFRLDGRAVVVTGAAGGIGRAVAREMVDAGARVFLTDVAAEPLQETLSDIGPGHFAEPVDLRDTASIARLVGRAYELLGGIDVLACVAGVIIRRNELSEVTEGDWDIQFSVNLRATFFLNRGVAEVMALGGGGSIINFASQGWWTGGYGGSVVYSATKSGVVALTRGLARTLAPQHIRVNAVAPGAVDTAMMRDGLTAEAKANFMSQVPVGRLGEPAELATTVRFLASDASSYITGATLNVSGGQLIY